MEAYIREKALSNYSKSLDESMGCEALLDLNHMINVYGRTFGADPQQFEFLAGDIKLIKCLVEHVKNEVDGKGANKGLHKFRGRKKKSAHSVGCNKMLKENVTPLHQLKTEDLPDTVETHSRHESLKMDLLRKTMNYLDSFEVDEMLAANFSEDMVEVDFDGKKIYGSIICVVCKDENAKNQRPKRVYYHESPESNYWVMANFLKHLKSHGYVCTQELLANKAKRKKAVHKNALKSKNGSPDVKLAYETDSIPIPESTVVKPDVYVIETIDNTIVEEGEKEVEINNSLEIVAVSMVPKAFVDFEMLYKQLSEQITKMIAANLNNGDDQEAMYIKLNGQERSVTVAAIDSNGDCLFAAICHQLSSCPIGCESHIKQTAKLRADVVNYILDPKNYPSFEYALQDRVYETKGPDKIENMTNECKIYTRHVLSRSGQWGGYETIKAVGEMFKINIIVVNEAGGCYIANQSEFFFDQTIALAYRNAFSGGKNDVRNHYDSISDIDTHILYDMAISITN